MKKSENFLDVQSEIIEFLEKNKGNGVKFAEIEFQLLKEKNLGVKIGGKFFINNIIRELVNSNQIKNIISNGNEYFFIE
ncbi:MAG: hypothetical protein EU548_02585 [Promethearchaeota archaeon]|nr:MAG: hypothetical protein EU548_02585 [Candidatus Lokiarchaeota archaeon]